MRWIVEAGGIAPLQVEERTVIPATEGKAADLTQNDRMRVMEHRASQATVNTDERSSKRTNAVDARYGCP
ncbi:hypothetical protein EDF70_1231 [Neorhizobium sp. JUb45]|nr:hypothetical protein EDF70_1231 [Neorhizobium sp. JUb45]